jgi:arylsulfatase A-like enzyme
MDTHDPYLPPLSYRNMFASRKSPSGVLNWRVGRDHLQSPEQRQGEIDAYDGAIAYVDTHIHQLLVELQKRHLDTNTLVVITSDHGEAFGEHSSYLHGNSLYREETHVPLIFWWPGRVPAGLRMEHPVTNAALPATVMDLLGMHAQTLFPGLSLAKLWDPTQAYLNWPYPLTEIEQIPWGRKEAPASHGSIKSMVSSLRHYIMHEKLGIELYDWKNDPHELHNLVERSVRCSDVKRLWSKLWALSYNRQITAAELLPVCNE